MSCAVETRRGYWIWAAVIMVLVQSAADPAWAQKEIRLKTIPEQPIPFVTTMVSPLARFAVVNDVANVLAVAHRPKAPTQLSIFKLDAQGQVVAGDPVTIALPKPAALGARPTNVLAMVSHPRLPLLYVWQDVEPLPNSMPTDPTHVTEFDHLLIYSLDESPPKLILATARGADYSPAAPAGAMAFNSQTSRLYVPNMQQLDRTKKVVGTIGWLMMDPDGLPAYAPPNAMPEESPAPAPQVPPLDATAAAAARTTKLAALEQAKAANMPLVMRRYQEPSIALGGAPVPYSYAVLNDDVVFAASHSGVASWALTDRLGRFLLFYLQPYVSYRYRIAVHPTAPALYVSALFYDGRLVRIEHADGQFTLAPQTLWLDSALYYSEPVVLPKTNQLVVGGNGHVVLADLDANGKFTSKVSWMTVNNPTVEALAWSAKFDKLYVPVEKMP